MFSAAIFQLGSPFLISLMTNGRPRRPFARIALPSGEWKGLITKTSGVEQNASYEAFSPRNSSWAFRNSEVRSLVAQPILALNAEELFDETPDGHGTAYFTTPCSGGAPRRTYVPEPEHGRRGMTARMDLASWSPYREAPSLLGDSVMLCGVCRGKGNVTWLKQWTIRQNAPAR